MSSTGAFCLLSQRSPLIELRLKAVVAEYTTCYNKSTDKARCHVIKGGRSVNQINAVTIGKLISAHRECDEQKFKAYVDFIAKAYEEQGNDRAANIIRSNYTGDYGEQGKVVLDEATEQTTYYETGWYEPEILGSGGSYRGVTKASSEEEALQRLQKHAANYAQRITVYKKDGKTVKREVAEYDQLEKKWRTA